MRKLVFVILLSISNILFACDKCMCKYLFDIIIANTTTEDCILTSQSIHNGTVYSKELPLRIAPGEQSKPYTIEYDVSNRQTQVSMSLQCGNDKFITIQSQRELSGFFYSTEKVIGMVTAAANLDASFVGKLSQCQMPKPATIYWNLK